MTVAKQSKEAIRPKLIVVLVAGVLAGLAQDALAAETNEAQSVIVTGTRSLKRTVADSEAPVDILTAKDLQASGSSELGEALNRLLPSLNFPRPAVADGTFCHASGNCAACPDQTLVLVNVKRLYRRGYGRTALPVGSPHLLI
jgi:iron complex outermembrane receptor protein